MILYLIFKSLIHFKFIIVCDVKGWSSFIFLHVCVQFSQHHIWNKLSLAHWMCLLPPLTINSLQRCGFISGLYILFHWSMCLFLCQYQAVFITMALYYSFILGSMIPPGLFFFLRIAVAMHGLLWFHINFWNICSSSVKYVIGILVGIVLNIEGFG